tara:strand:+ start:136 stop:1602 length:1467 start_codon:yes stop_codon:yes gene_type:complete
MAKLPRIIKNMQQGQMKKLQEGGTASEDIPAQQGGAGAFPTTPVVMPDVAKTISPISGLMPEQKIGLTTGEKVLPYQHSPTTQELVGDVQLEGDPTVQLQQADTSGLEVAVPTAQTAAQTSATYSSYTVANTPDAEAAQGTLSANAIIGDIQGTVSSESVAQAATGTTNETSTAKYHIGQLFASMTEGSDPPAWAAPAVRKVTAMMQQRGLGASSMAASAVTQAIMESGIPIALADAQTYSKMELMNLTNNQQTALRNAMTYAAMDTANLNARMQAATNNAKSFLAVDTQNLTQAQQANMATHQYDVQKLFTNQAQENAARQFNAKSESQVMQFFSELGAQVDNANKTRTAAMQQFNADQGNATARFVGQMEDSRDKFNSNMSAQIDQSNANWRRQVNTDNTAIINESNRMNAQNLLGLSVSAQNQLWQRYRDEAQWVLQKAENAATRAHSYAMTSQQNDFSRDTYETEFKDNMYSEMGRAILYGIFT